ncbi:MAG: TetR/AcrR family transcriptional regulator [Methylobacterium mesophilicum]|nr:TetR/AcrR family transcriptional regulator [Methylobacterium mesophilicum]
METLKERADTENTGCANGADGKACASPALSKKAKQILDGARSAFQELGYEGTSVDEIARRAGVSKPTLYTHFGDKQALFAASFARECQDYAETLFNDGDPESGECVEAKLRGIAHELVTFFVSPDAQCMFRSAVAEASRFPDLGRAYFKAGEATKKRIRLILERATERGLLAINDLDLAAHQFVVLCKADGFYKSLFMVEKTFSKSDIERIANGTVDLFLNGYRPRA